MGQKLWEKNVQVNAEIDRFTVGRDRELDLYTMCWAQWRISRCSKASAC